METPSEARPDASPGELVEEVDRDGSVLRLVTRSAMRAGRLRHRAVFVVVTNAAGDLLVHRRADSKDVWPGWWDIAVGGVTAPGESWETAARRELREETGIEAAVLEPLGTGLYEDDTVRVVGAVFRCESEGPFEFPDGEIEEAHWAKRGELGHWFAGKRFLPDSLALVLPRIGP